MKTWKLLSNILEAPPALLASVVSFHFQSAQQLLRTDPDLEGCKPSRVFLSYQAENASTEESGIPGEGVGHPNPRGLDLDTPALEEPWLLTVGTGLEESGHL